MAFADGRKDIKMVDNNNELENEDDERMNLFKSLGDGFDYRKAIIRRMFITSWKYERGNMTVMFLMPILLFFNFSLVLKMLVLAVISDIMLDEHLTFKNINTEVTNSIIPEDGEFYDVTSRWRKFVALAILSTVMPAIFMGAFFVMFQYDQSYDMGDSFILFMLAESVIIINLIMYGTILKLLTNMLKVSEYKNYRI